MKKNIIARMLALARHAAAFNGRGRIFELDEVEPPRSDRGGLNMPVVISNSGAAGASGVGGGFTNIGRSHTFGKTLGMHFDPVYHKYFNDFDVYSATDWTITDTGAGTSALVTAFDGGALQIKCDGAGNGDLRQHQLVKAGFLGVAGKPFMFGARLQVDDATLGLFIAGLQAVNANAFAPPADGMWFQKQAGNTHIDFNVSSTAAGLLTTADVAEAVAATQMSLEIVYDGEKKIHYGVNGKELGFVTDANFPTAVALAPILAIKNGSGVARNMQVDWLFAAKLR